MDTVNNIHEKVALAERIYTMLHKANSFSTRTMALKMDEALQKCWPVRDSIKNGGNYCQCSLPGICAAYTTCMGNREITGELDNKGKNYITIYAFDGLNREAPEAVLRAMGLPHHYEVVRSYDNSTVHLESQEFA